MTIDREMTHLSPHRVSLHTQRCAHQKLLQEALCTVDETILLQSRKFNDDETPFSLRDAANSHVQPAANSICFVYLNKIYFLFPTKN